jgi:hypothetical protein
MFGAIHTSGSYHRYVRRVAMETIHKSHILNDNSIPERVYKKIQWYMVESVFLGEILANLTDHSITKKEKESLVYLGAIMALFDVITDDFKLEESVVNSLFEDLNSHERRFISIHERAIEKVYHLFLEKLVETTTPEHWKAMSEHFDLIRFQIQSHQQLKENVTEESVNKITIGKGGVSVLLCSSFLSPVNNSFRRAMYELGGFIQMMNDCQDLYRDTIEGVITFVHFTGSFREIFDKLDIQRITSFRELKSLSSTYNGCSEAIFYFNAMFIVISYKLRRYAETCNYHLDFKTIAGMNKKAFIINPFSPRAVAACAGKIMRYEFESCENAHEF